MTVTDTLKGDFKIVSSDDSTILGALGEIMDYLSKNGINKDKIITIDATNKLAVIKT